MPVRLMGVPHLPSAAKQIALSIVVSGPVTLNASDAAFLNIGAAGDLWAPRHYMIKALLQLRQWVCNALVGEGSLAPDGGNPGSPANVLWTGDLSLSETAGASRVVLTLTDVGRNTNTTRTPETLDNTSG